MSGTRWGFARGRLRRKIAGLAAVGLGVGLMALPQAPVGTARPVSAAPVTPTAAPNNIFDLAASPTLSWTVPSDGVQMIESVEFVGAGGFGGDATAIYGSTTYNYAGGKSCQVYSSLPVTAGQVYKAYLGQRGSDGSQVLVDAGTNSARRLGGLGGDGFSALTGAIAANQGGKGGDSYTLSRQLGVGTDYSGGGGGGGATGIAEASGYPVPLVAAGGAGASANLKVDQFSSCTGGDPNFASTFGPGTNGCVSPACGRGATWTSPGAGGTDSRSGYWCEPGGSGGYVRATSGGSGLQSSGKGGDGAMGLTAWCNLTYGAAGGGGGGGGYNGGGGGASQQPYGAAGSGGTGSSRAASLHKDAKPATVGSLAYVRWATIDSTVLPSGGPGSSYSSTLTATFGDGPYYTSSSWTWTATGLPAGWSLNATSGALSGTVPATPTTFKVTATLKSNFFEVAKTSRMYTVGGNPAVAVTAKAASSTYGEAVAAVGYDASNLTADDWFTSITCGAFEDAAGTIAIDATTKPGTYKTVCSGAATTGLGKPITFATGNYTVNKAPLTITANSFTKTYGDTIDLDGETSVDPEIDITVTGLLGEDSVDAITLTSSGKAATAGVSGSPYSVVPTAATGTVASGALTDWYTITYVNGSITVNKAPGLVVTGITGILNVNASDVVSESSFYSTSGFLGSDTFSSPNNTAPTCTVYNSSNQVQTVDFTQPIAQQLTAGTYTITCSGGVAPNYDGITYSDATLVIKPPSGQVNARNATSVYGSTPATVVFDHVDVPTADQAGVTCGAYTDSSATSPVTASTKPGTYFTRCSGPTTTTDGSGRAINYADGVYTVLKAPLTLVTHDQTKTYGATVSGSSTTSGLVNGDTITVSYSYTGTPAGNLATAGVGTYTITSSATLDGGRTLGEYYDVTVETGTLTVNRATLTIIADPAPSSVTFGDDPPTYGYTVKASDLRNGDTDAVVTGVTCVSSYTNTTPEGSSSPVTCSGGSADNYTLVYESGAVTVQNAGISVENTTNEYWPTSTDTAVVTFRASLLGGDQWAPGCLVTFTLDPSAGTDSPYSVYPNETQVVTGSPVTVDAVLPIGVYNVVTTLSGNCSADTAIADGFVVVSPSSLGVGTTGGGWYRTSNGGPKHRFGYVVQAKSVKDKTGTTTTYWGESLWSVQQNWRLKASIKKTVTQYSNGTLSGVAPYGTFTCPKAWGSTGAPNARCGSFMGEATLQQWVPDPIDESNPDGASGSWEDVGVYNYTVTLYDGAWLTTCKNKVCKTTDLADFYGLAIRQIPGGPRIPAAVPTSVPPTQIPQGQIRIWAP